MGKNLVGISCDLNFSTYGSGRPLIVLHGLFGSQVNWRSFGKRFGEYCKVFTLDLRNHGDSPHGDEFNYEVLAKDVAEFIENAKLKDVVLLGHSLGGKVAMQLAATCPDLIEKMIVVDIAPKQYPAVDKGIIDALEALDLKSFSRLQEVIDALALDIPLLEIRMFLVKNLKRDSNRQFQWRINLKAISNHFKEILKPPAMGQLFDKPVLFIKGEKSDYLTQADIKAARKTFRKAKMVTIKGAGHWVHIDEPDTFAQVVQFFMQN